MRDKNAKYIVPSIYHKVKSQNAPLCVTVPGSKSITNRALLLATLAEGESVLKGVLFSDDSRHFLKCVQDLGFETTVNEDAKVITVKGMGGEVPLKEASQYVGSAGTAARFLTAYLGISEGTYHMDASEQMRKRPMAPLLNSLKELGCEVIYDEDANEGHFPFTIKSHGFGKDHITVNIDSSSQFMSALLIASCLSKESFTTMMEGEHGLAYVTLTAKMMDQFGVMAEPLYYCGGNSDSHTCSGCENSARPYAYKVASGQKYHALDYQVEPDLSAACYFYAMSPLLNIPVIVENVHFDSMQGDVAFIRVLEQMGCTTKDTEKGILVNPPANGVFNGVTVDMSAFSDQAITLAAIAPFAETPTTITGIGHIRLQESDRIHAICTELTKMGIRCVEGDAEITVYPGSPKASSVDTYDDHRMAMGFSLIGLRSEDPITINDPYCCEKTFENYFEVLQEVISKLQ